MKVLKKKSEDCIYITVKVFSKMNFAHIDYSCNGVIINQKIADLHVSNLPKFEAKGHITNGSLIVISWICSPLSFVIGTQKLLLNVCTPPDIYEILLGTPFIAHGHVKFDFDHNRIVLNEEFISNANYLNDILICSHDIKEHTEHL